MLSPVLALASQRLVAASMINQPFRSRGHVLTPGKTMKDQSKSLKLLGTMIDSREAPLSLFVSMRRQSRIWRTQTSRTRWPRLCQSCEGREARSSGVSKPRELAERGALILSVMLAMSFTRFSSRVSSCALTPRTMVSGSTSAFFLCIADKHCRETNLSAIDIVRNLTFFHSVSSSVQSRQMFHTCSPLFVLLHSISWSKKRINLTILMGGKLAVE